MGAVAPHRRDDGGTLRENRGKAFQRRRHLCNLTEIEGFARFDGVPWKNRAVGLWIRA
jgi:hypothetical protein